MRNLSTTKEKKRRKPVRNQDSGTKNKNERMLYERENFKIHKGKEESWKAEKDNKYMNRQPKASECIQNKDSAFGKEKWLNHIFRPSKPSRFYFYFQIVDIFFLLARLN